MPEVRKLDYSDEFLESLKKSGETLLEKYKNINWFGEQVHSEDNRELLYMESDSVAIEDMRATMIEAKSDPKAFCEVLLGRELTITEKAYFEWMSAMGSLIDGCSIPYIPYKYCPFGKSRYSFFPYYYGKGIVSVSSKPVVWIDMENILQEYDYINNNCKKYSLYPYSRFLSLPEGFISIDEFVKEMKDSKQWELIHFSIKNESEDLHPYKNITYPWDENKSESKENHRKEIKATGGDKSDFHSKSGRRDRKRCKVV